MQMNHNIESYYARLLSMKLRIHQFQYPKYLVGDDSVAFT
jgi:hypothetical protein